MLSFLLAGLLWLASLAAALWFLKTVHAILQELTLIRRYLEALYERNGRR